ncbi:MAG: hypothetical protein JST16_11985 [Bdellovibrionales bacterium]|nr:hypothetical protein [Bdellovibrionales bacterium]
MTDTEELSSRLEKLAFAKSTPFCYSDYIPCPTGRCPKCASDDLMRFVGGIGVEYGTDWVVKHLLEEALEPVDVSAAFEDSVRECYPETTQVGWLTLDTVGTIKESDPVSWRCAESEWEDAEVSDGNIVSFDNGSTYYWTHEIESWLDEEERGAA